MQDIFEKERFLGQARINLLATVAAGKYDHIYDVKVGRSILKLQPNMVRYANHFGFNSVEQFEAFIGVSESEIVTSLFELMKSILENKIDYFALLQDSLGFKPRYVSNLVNGIFFVSIIDDLGQIIGKGYSHNKYEANVIASKNAIVFI